MKDLRLSGLLLVFLLQLVACNSAKIETPDTYSSDNLGLLKMTSDKMQGIDQKIPADRKDVISKHENDGMMEVELGTVAQALHPKLSEGCRSIWLPPKRYILLMENFIIENGVLRECFSIKN